MTNDERSRLVKILGMLGSDHAGERDAAAMKAAQFMRERKLQWGDVIGSSRIVATPPPRPPPQPPHPPVVPPPPTVSSFHAVLDWCLNRDDQLTDWELHFARSVHFSNRTRITEKQLEVVARIYQRIRDLTS